MKAELDPARSIGNQGDRLQLLIDIAVEWFIRYRRGTAADDSFAVQAVIAARSRTAHHGCDAYQYITAYTSSKIQILELISSR